jgi:hypothetical protein
MPDFSITTCARSSAGAARGTFPRGDSAGVGTATARGGGEVESSDRAAGSSGGGVGVFSGVGASFSLLVAFAVFLPFDATFFVRDFFFAPFGFGVGLEDFLDFFGGTVESGVSVGFGVSSSSSPVSFSGFFLLRSGDSSAVGDASVSVAFDVTDVSASLLDSSVASLAFGIGLGDFLGVGEVLRFFFDLLASAFALAPGFGDFFGVGVGEARVSCWLFPDSSLDFSSSLLTCPRRRLPAIALSATAVVSQRRKRTTAAERNRARDAINRLLRRIVKKVTAVTKRERF